jgi:pimeloyl-ACP methyl ester carboxylesterase
VAADVAAGDRTPGTDHGAHAHVGGGNDFPAAAADADRLASSIAGAQKVVIENAGHMVNMDAPVAFSDAVLTFLREDHSDNQFD